MTGLRSDIAIIGGGLAGMTLAIACGMYGIRTVLVEAEALPDLTDQRYDGRSSAIAYGSQQVLSAIGAWPYLRDQAQPILDIRVTDGGGFQRDARRAGGISPFFVHYNHRDLPLQDATGSEGQPPFGYIVENRASRTGLIRHLRQVPAVTHLAPATASSVDLRAEGATVRLADGREIETALVVAADGRRSALRDFAGIAPGGRHACFVDENSGTGFCVREGDQIVTPRRWASRSLSLRNPQGLNVIVCAEGGSYCHRYDSGSRLLLGGRGIASIVVAAPGY